MTSKLVQDGHTVICMIRKNCLQQAKHGVFEHVEMTNEASIEQAIQKHADADLLIHLAAIMDFYPHAKCTTILKFNAVAHANMIETNVNGTKYLLQGNLHKFL